MVVTKQDVLEIFKDCDLSILTEDNFYEELLDYIPEEYEYEDRCGATKVAIHFKDTDFVVKIPFYDSGLTGAKDGIDGSDYLLAETFIYEEAENVGLEQFFAKTEIIGQIDGYNIYCQPLCEIGNSYACLNPNMEKAKEICNSVKESCDSHDYYCFNSIWLGEVLNKFGEQVFKDICDFIDLYEINDLHVENLGHYNGIPVLFDYSGYHN